MEVVWGMTFMANDHYPFYDESGDVRCITIVSHECSYDSEEDKICSKW